jgi:hypothetical protein
MAKNLEHERVDQSDTNVCIGIFMLGGLTVLILLWVCCLLPRVLSGEQPTQNPCPVPVQTPVKVDNEALDVAKGWEWKNARMREIIDAHCSLADSNTKQCDWWYTVLVYAAYGPNVASPWSAIARAYDFAYDPWTLNAHTVATHFARLYAHPAMKKYGTDEPLTLTNKPLDVASGGTGHNEMPTPAPKANAETHSPTFESLPLNNYVAHPVKPTPAPTVRWPDPRFSTWEHYLKEWKEERKSTWAEVRRVIGEVVSQFSKLFACTRVLTDVNANGYAEKMRVPYNGQIILGDTSSRAPVITDVNAREVPDTSPGDLSNVPHVPDPIVGTGSNQIEYRFEGDGIVISVPHPISTDTKPSAPKVGPLPVESGGFQGGPPMRGENILIGRGGESESTDCKMCTLWDQLKGSDPSSKRRSVPMEGGGPAKPAMSENQLHLSTEEHYPRVGGYVHSPKGDCKAPAYFVSPAGNIATYCRG